MGTFFNLFNLKNIKKMGRKEGSGMPHKDCPKCKKGNHVAVKTCACGHVYLTPKREKKPARTGPAKPRGAQKMPKKPCPQCNKESWPAVRTCPCGFKFPLKPKTKTKSRNSIKRNGSTDGPKKTIKKKIVKSKPKKK